MTTRSLRASVLLAALLVLPSCLSSPPGYKRAQTVAEEALAYKTAVLSVSDSIAKTSESLGALGQADADPRPAYDRFAAALEGTSDAADDADSAASDLEKSWRSFVNAWEKDTAGIQSVSVRERAQKRRAETSVHFDSISADKKHAGDVLGPYLAELTDLRKYLDHDVTPAGIASAQDLLLKARQDGDHVRSLFQDLAGRVDQARKAIAPMQEAPAKVQ